MNTNPALADLMAAFESFRLGADTLGVQAKTPSERAYPPAFAVYFNPNAQQ